MPKNNSKQGMKLHKFIATGGKPKDFRGANRDFGTTAQNSSKKK